MRFYLKLIGLNLKGQMQYRTSFFLSVIGQFLTAFASFFGLRFVAERVGAVDGFTLPQVFLCFSVVMLTFSVGELFGAGFQVFPRLLGNGRFDRALVSPRRVLPQILARNADFTRVGLTAQALLVLCCAAPNSGVEWTAAKALTLALMILCGSALFFGLFLAKAAFSFFTLESLDFLNVFTYGARQFGRYPFSIYGDGVLRFLTFVVPLATFQYYPLLYLLDRERGALFMLSPLLGLLLLIPCALLFRFGLRAYQSTGS